MTPLDREVAKGEGEEGERGGRNQRKRRGFGGRRVQVEACIIQRIKNKSIQGEAAFLIELFIRFQCQR